MTVPCAATSRTKCPLATVTMRSRSAATTWLELDHARISQPTSSATMMPPATQTYTQRCRCQGRLGAAIAVSCFSVPRTDATRLSSASFMERYGAHHVPTHNSYVTQVLTRICEKADASGHRTADRASGHFADTLVDDHPGDVLHRGA